jgi:sigma-B regulation protein RsbU (phosphoserine phosphatase)
LRSSGTLEVLDHHGPVIGLGGGKPFGQEEKKLQRGDRVVLYTDGILENSNSAGEAFGKHRFYEALQRHRTDSVEGMVEAVYAEVKNFGKAAELDDDISILAVEYVGETPGAKQMDKAN